MGLANEHCVACKTGEGRLSDDEIPSLLAAVPGWARVGETLQRTLKFKNFMTALAFVNRLADIAESQGHHPDIAFGWGYVEITLTTHAAGGLSRNDFILAARIDALPNATAAPVK